MRKILYLLMTAFIVTACNESKTVMVTVSNPIGLERTHEMVEVSMNDITAKLQMSDSEQLVIRNADGVEVPYQITFDDMIIFPASVLADSVSVYTIQVGIPEMVAVKACGRFYPERKDDLAWENDLVAFRAYGPALQASGERAFGYDVWTKYNTTDPVVEARYAMELNPETLARIDSLKKDDIEAAKELRAATSYHVDHGNGLDCYKVGPTLGGGTAALMNGEEILYPYCFASYEILDNGPLRFTLKLEYSPLVVKNDSNVIESRVISLDAGSHLNKTIVSYAGLNEVTPVATGLVLHEQDGIMATDAAEGYITYVDPTDNPTADNGKIFVGAVFPANVNEAKAVLFDEKERSERGADGHVLSISDYKPASNYTYYWGSAWSKADIKDVAGWNKYVSEFAKKVRNPLTVTVK